MHSVFELNSSLEENNNFPSDKKKKCIALNI